VVSADKQAAPPPKAVVRPSSAGPVIPLLFGCGLVACATLTQTLAASLAYSPALGRPLYAPSLTHALLLRLTLLVAVVVAGIVATVRGSWKPFVPGVTISAGLALVSIGPIYAPVAGVVWAARLLQQPAHALLAQQAALAASTTGGLTFVTGWLLLPQAPPREPSGAFGTARFGDPSPLKTGQGPIIGRADGELLRYPGDGHLITFSPTGGGKGIGSVLPNCLTYPGSLVVTDPKGENAAVAARARRDLGQQVAWLDPWKVLDSVGGPVGDDGFNPLDFIAPNSPDANDDAWLLGEQLIPPSYAGSDDGHWLDQARAFLSGLVLHIATSVPVGDENRCLPFVRHCVCLPDQGFDDLLKAMTQNPAADGSVARVATLFRRIMTRSEKEFGSIMSTVARHTWFLDSPRIRRVMARSSFDMDALKAGRLSLFVTVPPHRLDTYGAWLRVNLACAIAATSRVVGRPEHKVLLIFDEAGNAGTLPELPRTVTLSRGAGLTVWAIFQDISQPKALYNTRWATFFANADVLQSFGTNDHETASLLSSMAGDETIVVESANASQSRNRGGRGGAGSSRGTGVTASERGRKLLMPDEVRRLDSTRQLVFLRGRDPLLVDRVSYLKDREFAGLYDPNPTYRPVLRKSVEVGS
jgi:type IV secretion system protein VirD4